MKRFTAPLSDAHPAQLALCSQGTPPKRGASCLNVTEQERLCYSRKKLQVLSALRSIGVLPPLGPLLGGRGVHPSLFGLHKDYRVPGVRGKVYLMEHPTGDLYHFSSLAEIHLYVAEYQAWQAQSAFTWKEPPKRGQARRYAPAYPASTTSVV